MRCENYWKVYLQINKNMIIPSTKPNTPISAEAIQIIRPNIINNQSQAI